MSYRDVEKVGPAAPNGEPGPGGEPLSAWIDVREILAEVPSDD